MSRHFDRKAMIGGDQNRVTQQRRRQIEAVVDRVTEIARQAHRARQQERQLDRDDRRVREVLCPQAHLLLGQLAAPGFLAQRIGGFRQPQRRRPELAAEQVARRLAADLRHDPFDGHARVYDHVLS